MSNNTRLVVSNSVQSKWEKFKRKWQGCSKCKIRSRTKHVVLARGKIPASILFIGEAPGPSERVTGRPFTGTAGTILDALIDQAGIQWGDYCITNLISCFPYDAEASRLSFRVPSEYEISNCQPRLVALQAIVRPKIWVSLGEEAKNKYTPPPGSWSLELQHPSFIARSGGEDTLTFKRNLARLKNFYELHKDKINA